MPFITVKMLEGRSDDQKRRLVEAITAAMTDICGAPPEHTHIVIEEVRKDHWARDGAFASDREKPRS